MINKAEIIKSAIAMDDVLSDFAGIDKKKGRHRRSDRCPINDCEGHDGFSWNKRVFHCFVCGASGDVISFVEQYLHCDFKTACDEINAKYHLWDDNLDNGGLSDRESLAIAERSEDHRQQRRAKNVKHHNADAVRDTLNQIDADMIKYAPKTPDDELDPRFVRACHSAGIIDYLYGDYLDD